MIDHAAIEKDIAKTLGISGVSTWTFYALCVFRCAYREFGLRIKRGYPVDGHDDSWLATMPHSEDKYAAMGRTLDECTANFIEAEWERLTDAEAEERRAIFFPVYAFARGE